MRISLHRNIMAASRPRKLGAFAEQQGTVRRVPRVARIDGQALQNPDNCLDRGALGQRGPALPKNVASGPGPCFWRKSAGHFVSFPLMAAGRMSGPPNPTRPCEKRGHPDPAPASAGNLQAFRLLSSDGVRPNERPTEDARLDGLQQIEVQPLPSSMSRGRDPAAGAVSSCRRLLRKAPRSRRGVFLYASPKIFRLYANDVFVKRTWKPTNFGRNGSAGHDAPPVLRIVHQNPAGTPDLGEAR